MIRRAGIDDAEEILFVINTSHQKAYKSIFSNNCNPVLSMEELIKDFNAMTFYGYEEEKILGVAALRIEDKTGWIRWVYILTDYQRKGIGTALLLHLEEEAKKKKLTQLRLHALEKDYRAVNFYRKLGYESIDRVPGPYGLDLLMEKKVSP
jgi:ribosomal protein S18 acetylase RimI-like enzyme